MAQILFIGAQIVFDGNAIVFTDNAAACRCCVIALPCVECPTGQAFPKFATVTLAGFTDAFFCSNCASVNTSYVCQQDTSGSNPCCWTFSGPIAACVNGSIQIQLCLEAWQTVGRIACTVTIGNDNGFAVFTYELTIGSPQPCATGMIPNLSIPRISADPNHCNGNASTCLANV